MSQQEQLTQLTQLTQVLFDDDMMIDFSNFDERNRQPSWSELHDELDQLGTAHMLQKYGPTILKELGHDNDDVIPGAQPPRPSFDHDDNDNDDENSNSPPFPVFFNDGEPLFIAHQLEQQEQQEEQQEQLLDGAKYAHVTFPNGTRVRAGPFYSNIDMVAFIHMLNH